MANEQEVFFRLFDKKSDDNGDRGVKECPLAVGAFPPETPLAMAYVPFQVWETPYEEDVALQRGTIFRSLDKPFIGEEAVKNGDTK